MKAARKRKEEPQSWWSMASTQAQRNLLKSLGVEDVQGLTRGQAAEMIDSLRQENQKPSRLDLELNAEMDRYIALPYT